MPRKSVDSQDKKIAEGFELAVRVRALRKKLGLNQEQFAKALDVSASTIWKWEDASHPNKPRKGPAKAALERLEQEANKSGD